LAPATTDIATILNQSLRGVSRYLLNRLATKHYFMCILGNRPSSPFLQAFHKQIRI